MSDLRIIVTGGTFDKEYDEIKGELGFRNTHVHAMLKRARVSLNVEVEEVVLIDSLFMTDGHREEILKRCKFASEDHIVITHGTDSMPETAIYLAGKLPKKTVVLTGAMVPYTFGGSDSMFNFGSAISFAQTLPEGVYVAMNGRYFRHDVVYKDTETGNFRSMSSNNNGV